MGQTIHLNPDAMRAIAREMQTFSSQVQTIAAETGGRVQRMEWIGGAREMFVDQVAVWQRQVERLARDVEALSARLSREIDEWVQADALFGAGSGAKSGSIASNASTQWPKGAPRDMQDLARMTQESPGITIKRIGPNDYLVLVAGTELFSKSRGWFVEGGGAGLREGKTSTMATKLLEAIRRYVPKGANVHLSGYSQGGMTVQWVATRLQSEYKIKSVTGFGSGAYRERVPGAQYNIFVEQDDLVAQTAASQGPFDNKQLIRFIDDERKESKLPRTIIVESYKGLYTVKRGIDEVHDKIEGAGKEIEDFLNSIDDAAGDLFEGAGKKIEGAGKEIEDFLNSIGGAAGDLFEGAGKKIEGAGKEIEDFLNSSIGDAAGDLFEGAGKKIEGAGKEIEDFLNSIGGAAGDLFEGAGKKIEGVGKEIEDFLNFSIGDAAGDLFEGAERKIEETLRPMEDFVDDLKGPLKGPVDSVGKKVNELLDEYILSAHRYSDNEALDDRKLPFTPVEFETVATYELKKEKIVIRADGTEEHIYL